ncbi:MAG: beta-propeller fold lactonase family protein, partial [Motiliproteus sp.]
MNKLVKFLQIGSLAFSLSIPNVQAKNTGYVFVSSEKDDVVTVFDSAKMNKVSEIPTSERPRAMKLNADGSLLYVACGDGNSIDVIDVASLKVKQVIDIGDDPDRFDLSPNENHLYASNEDDGMVTVYDLKAN